ncbi:MAG: tetratricopeptide repeat protein [FCB group bacterium]|nr:tetratricopeptide repeat protein [FCB group bacterium]
MTDTNTPQRKLAAIMFTDIVGYTMIMGEDEQKALRLLEKNRTIIKSIIEEFRGEWLKEMGDGTLSCFASAVDAVRCALKVQHLLKDDPDLILRIGIHIGDVVFEGGDVFGDGVNVASRIEPLAMAGGICITDRVHDDIQNQADIHTVFIGEHSLKHVKRTIKVFALAGDGLPTHPSDTEKPTPGRHSPSAYKQKRSAWIGALTVIVLALIIYVTNLLVSGNVELTPRLGDHSVAVLPFTNLSGGQENEYFSDGMTEDILTHLSKIAGLSVVSRTSIMPYKNTEKTIREIGAELGVAAILEGSVRRAGDMVRITGQLIDARTDKHLWANNYDRKLVDIFSIQSDVAFRIADALKATITTDNRDRIQQTPTDSMAAYDYFLKGKTFAHNWSMRGGRKQLENAIEMYDKAVAIDPDFLLAYVRLVKTHLWMYWSQAGGFDRSEARLALAKQALEKAQALDPDHPETHLATGWYHYRGFLEYEKALEEFAIALEYQPNNSELLAVIGYVKRRQGNWEEAAKYQTRATELDPLDYMKNDELAATYIYMRDWEKADQFNKRCLIIAPEDPRAHRRNIDIILKSTGNTEKAWSAFNQSKKTLGPDAYISWSYSLELYDRNYKRLLEILQTRDGNNELKGWLYNILGEQGKALVAYDTLRARAERYMVRRPDYADPHFILGIAYAGLGQKEDAISEGLRAVEMEPVSSDAWYGPYSIYKLAVIYQMVGNYEAAIDQLELVLSIPSTFTGPLLAIDPRWDPLREHPRFQALIADNAAKMN